MIYNIPIIRQLSLHLQQILHRKNLTYRLKREILVVHNHPFLTLFAGEIFDVRKHRNRNDNFASVSKKRRHRPTLDLKIKFLDAQICIFVSAHIFLLQFHGVEFKPSPMQTPIPLVLPSSFCPTFDFLSAQKVPERQHPTPN